MQDVIFVINPGSTSTKYGIFSQNGAVLEESVEHDIDSLKRFEKATDQFNLRYEAVKTAIKKHFSPENQRLVAVVGRGGPLKPLDGGIYRINDKMLDDYASCRYANHASNMGSMIADKLAKEWSVPAFIVDPVTVDNFWDISRISGFPGIERKCRSHALNIRATARRHAESLGKKIHDVNYVVAHIGGGISICALEGGKVRDVNDGLLGEGPFSPQRAGILPLNGVIDLCFSGKSRKEIERDFSINSGFQGYLGTSDLREVLEKTDSGDQNAQLIYRAFVFQVAKEIGREAAALKGNYEAILITGGIAHSERFITDLKAYITFLGPVSVYPGEGEMNALGEAGFLAVSGKIPVKEYC
ncbi:MAG: butyrate kinase [Acidobacteria bacterium]|nr:butyrate kinase [Acidobacteriota bacterium]